MINIDATALIVTLFERQKRPWRWTRLALWTASMSCASLALAQSNLGELLDAGATPLSVDEFKNELVGRAMVGPTATGGTLEVMYAPNGSVHGAASFSYPMAPYAPINGEWTIDRNGRTCTSMRIGAAGGGTVGGVVLPPRCQLWFKHGELYFLSDSDSDRQARVLRRTLKP